MSETLGTLTLIAGEASGDLLAGLLLQGIHQRWPDARANGVGGAHMAQQGFEAWASSDKLAVHGLVEVLRVYRDLAKFRRMLIQRICTERPDVFIGVDAPDFNFEVERQVRAAGIKTVHFVSPSIWAWRGWRLRRILRATDHMLCLFPFEPEIYQRAGLSATFVGHPLADVIPLHPDRARARLTLGLPLAAPVVALLPGSRRGEISHLVGRFLQAAQHILQARQDVRFVMPCAPNRREAIEAELSRHLDAVPIVLCDGQAHQALAACDVTLVASGTATLEAALFKRPMVVAYAQHPVSHFLMKRMAYLPWVALPNILLRDFAVPELLQEQANPKALAAAVLKWLDDAPGIDRLAQRFNELHHVLQRDTARCATEAIAQVCDVH